MWNSPLDWKVEDCDSLFVHPWTIRAVSISESDLKEFEKRLTTLLQDKSEDIEEAIAVEEEGEERERTS